MFPYRLEFFTKEFNVRMFSIISFQRNFKIHPSPPEISACKGFFLYSFAKVYFHIFTYVRYLHIFSPELYFFIIIFAHLFQESKSPRRPPGLIASFCGARHGCAPVHHVVRWWNKYGIRICLFSRLSETNAIFVLVSWRDLFLYPRKHETKNW